MKISEDISFTKNEYTLKDFAMFKLCPMLYAYSVLFPEKATVNEKQRLLELESDILYNAFSSFAKDNENTKTTFFKSTSRGLKNVNDKISKLCLEKLSQSNNYSLQQTHQTANNLFNKAWQIFNEIHHWVRGASYTIIGGAEMKYPFKDFDFVYRSHFRAFDCSLNKYKTLYIKEYKVFPVLSAGSKHKDLIHYRDILDALNGNDKNTDRVNLAMKIIKKINIQLESTLYINDGLERIQELATEIKNYDFSKPYKKESEFCKFCRYYDKCF